MFSEISPIAIKSLAKQSKPQYAVSQNCHGSHPCALTGSLGSESGQLSLGSHTVSLSESTQFAVQLLEHESVSFEFPSSQSSGGWTNKSPQAAVVQLVVQESLLFELPSSHVSLPSVTLFPQTEGVQAPFEQPNRHSSVVSTIVVLAQDPNKQPPVVVILVTLLPTQTN